MSLGNFIEFVEIYNALDLTGAAADYKSLRETLLSLDKVIHSFLPPF